MSVQTNRGNKLTAFGLCLDAAGFDGHSGRAEFGVKVGVDAVTVWRWYSGRSRPNSRPTRQAIAKVLKKSEADVDTMFAPTEAKAA